jgi:hypothetical protein
MSEDVHCAASAPGLTGPSDPMSLQCTRLAFVPVA